MTSISWVICFMERSNLSQPMPATKEAQREELAEVDVDWLIAERPGR
jgi:IS5 family transposase